MSPGLASPRSPAGIWTSMISRRSNGTTKPMPESSTSKRPTIVAAPRSRMRTIRPSARSPLTPLDARDDAVAVHRLVQVAAGDVEVAATSSIGRSGTTNPKPRGLVSIRPTTRFIRSGRPNRLPRVFDQIAAGNERLEMPAQRRPLVPRHAKHLQQFLNGRRMIGALPDERQHQIAGKHAQGSGCAAAEIAWTARSAGACAS